MFKVILDMATCCDGRSTSTRMLSSTGETIKEAVTKALIAFDCKAAETIGEGMLLCSVLAARFEFIPPIPRQQLAKAWVESVTDMSQCVTPTDAPVPAQKST